MFTVEYKTPWCLVCVTEAAIPVSEEISYSRDEDVYEILREMSSRGRYSPFISILLPNEGAAER
jgi:hypothetical protein